ncbi:hypothetical protein [Salimicrobium flavidum]|uniref:Uncharacterized protein n=1 Tax=Salimicrobium flavidum TaxID=570947 RepID=A0A1N7J8X2_9BACI|nr:hypothetical protein [Salimicrobium flavidum]SIS45727.1 hypothetical protein SAMN05421687_104157 [Salimicrobium flavidum]
MKEVENVTEGAVSTGAASLCTIIKKRIDAELIQPVTSIDGRTIFLLEYKLNKEDQNFRILEINYRKGPVEEYFSYIRDSAEKRPQSVELYPPIHCNFRNQILGHGYHHTSRQNKRYTW